MTGPRRGGDRDRDVDPAGSASTPRSGAETHAETPEDASQESAPSASRSIPHEAIRIRPLNSRDVSAIAPLLTLAAASGLSTPPPVLRDEGTNDEDDPGAFEHDEYWLAEHDGQILGFALLHHVDRQRAAIRAVWVDERHRRMGVGKRLLEGTVLHCQRAGYLKLVLELPFSLEKMVPLFGRLGFSFARRRAVNGNTLLEFYLDLYREPGL